MLGIWRRVFLNGHDIYKYARHLPRVSAHCDARIDRYDSASEVPTEVLRQIEEREGRQSVRTIRGEFLKVGELYVGWVGEKVASRMWVRAGRHMEDWFVLLREDDCVLFGMLAYPAFRGLGIIGALITEAIERNGGGDGDVYVDCKLWNRSSMRVFDKMAFKRISTKRPLRRQRPVVIESRNHYPV